MTSPGDLRPVLDEALAVGRAAARSGKVASFIPALSQADPAHAGLAVATIDGGVWQAGEANEPFTFQSVSKVFALACVMRDRGLDALNGMSCEPSGDAFHSIVRLEEENGRPRNPYINAGAIMISERLPGTGPDEKAAALQRFLTALCPEASFPVDDAVYRSETETGYRNRALAHYMRHFGVIDDPRLAVETYFRQCAIRLDTVQLAHLGLFLANRGVNPATGEPVLDTDCARTVVAQMAMCGLYDEVGHFAVNVGFPAKSGVSGAMLGVVPGRMAIAAYGPALGPQGNSMFGMAALSQLSRAMSLSIF